MNTLYTSSSRNGKIAHLPHSIREQINNRLQNKEPAKTILPWLNQLREVKSILATHFESRPITKQNLSEWKKGGFRDWLIRQHALEFAENLENDDALGAQPLSGNFTDKLARWLAIQYAAATRSFTDDENSPSHWNRLREFCADICRLRRADFHSQLLQIKRDWLAHEKANADYLKEKQFIEWAKERRLWIEPERNRGVSKEALHEFKVDLGIEDPFPEELGPPAPPSTPSDTHQSINPSIPQSNPSSTPVPPSPGESNQKTQGEGLSASPSESAMDASRSAKAAKEAQRAEFKRWLREKMKTM